MYPVHPEMIHRNNPKHEIFRFDIQSEIATETEFKTLLSTIHKQSFCLKDCFTVGDKFFCLNIYFFAFAQLLEML